MESQSVMNGLPPIRVGTQPIDGNHYIFTDGERKEFLNSEPDSEPLFRPYFGAYDFLYGRRRWILHLSGVPQDVLAKFPHVTERVEMVRKAQDCQPQVGHKGGCGKSAGIPYRDDSKWEIHCSSYHKLREAQVRANGVCRSTGRTKQWRYGNRQCRALFARTAFIKDAYGVA